ncbi:hypothetical protein BC829DRAFT_147426 [Chytridium lagenaria]|nr:hypothetical protein BC829DRAFT_147426 [Chytridium lagenaria]
MVNYNVSDHYELSRLVHASDKKIPGIMWLKNKDLKTIPGVGDVNRPSFRCAKDVINFFKLHFNNPELAYTVPIYPHDTMFENNDRSDILTPDRIDDRIVEQGRAFACYNESGLEGVFDPFPAGNKRSLGLLKNDFWVFTDFEYIHEVVDNWNGAGEFALDQVLLVGSHRIML